MQSFEYSIDSTNLTLKGTFGTHTVVGYGEGSVITITEDEDALAVSRGAKGETTYAKNPYGVFSISVTLSSQSPTNSILSQLRKDMERFSVSFIDENQQSYSFTSNQAMVLKYADKGIALEETNRTWTIKCSDVDIKE